MGTDGVDSIGDLTDTATELAARVRRGMRPRPTAVGIIQFYLFFLYLFVSLPKKDKQKSKYEGL
jgi:hypothetical protein